MSTLQIVTCYVIWNYHIVRITIAVAYIVEAIGNMCVIGVLRLSNICGHRAECLVLSRGSIYPFALALC